MYLFKKGFYVIEIFIPEVTFFLYPFDMIVFLWNELREDYVLN